MNITEKLNSTTSMNRRLCKGKTMSYSRTVIAVVRTLGGRRYLTLINPRLENKNHRLIVFFWLTDLLTLRGLSVIEFYFFEFFVIEDWLSSNPSYKNRITKSSKLYPDLYKTNKQNVCISTSWWNGHGKKAYLKVHWNQRSDQVSEQYQSLLWSSPNVNTNARIDRCQTHRESW